jgi:nucleoside-diphosphate kinase
MPLQRTLAIVKPDAVARHKVGAIIERLEADGFTVVALKRLQLTLQQARGFYEVHRGRPFFDDLTKFMSRGPILAMVLEAENAVQRYREVIGATDPSKAAPGTLRKLYGTDVGENALHGSDSPETAQTEVLYFFAGYEISPIA